MLLIVKDELKKVTPQSEVKVTTYQGRDVMRVYPLLALCVLSLSVLPSFGADLEVVGHSKTTITEDVQTVAGTGKNLAVRDAIVNAINKVLGANSTDKPEVQAKIDTVAAQVESFKLNENASPQRIGTDYVLTVNLTLDEKKFRKLLSDEGLASNTATTRSSAILMLMDEFFTKPSDINAPVEELVEYKRDKGSQKAEASGSASSDVGSSSLDAAAVESAQQQSAAAVATPNGQAQAAQSSSYSAGARVTASESHDKKSASFKQAAQEKHDNTYFKKLVRYQPRNVGPEKQNYTLRSLAGIFQDYDIKIINNDIFKSKYFGNKPITLDKLQAGKELASYATFARKEANSDFFSVGSSVIIDTGKSNDTGNATCNGLTSVAIYSTNDGEEIASESVSESASGDSSDQCRGNVATKLAETLGKTVATRVQEYWKRREMYGREFVVTYTGKLNLGSRTAFMNAVKKTQGVAKAVQRSSSENEYQVVITYKGETPIDQALAGELVSSPVFANIDSKVEGTLVKLCPGSCAGNRAPASTKH